MRHAGLDRRQGALPDPRHIDADAATPCPDRASSPACRRPSSADFRVTRSSEPQLYFPRATPEHGGGGGDADRQCRRADRPADQRPHHRERPKRRRADHRLRGDARHAGRAACRRRHRSEGAGQGLVEGESRPERRRHRCHRERRGVGGRCVRRRTAPDPASSMPTASMPGASTSTGKRAGSARSRRPRLARQCRGDSLRAAGLIATPPSRVTITPDTSFVMTQGVLDGTAADAGHGAGRGDDDGGHRGDHRAGADVAV